MLKKWPFTQPVKMFNKSEINHNIQDQCSKDGNFPLSISVLKIDQLFIRLQVFFYQSFWFNVRRQKKTHTTLQIYVVVDLWIWLENTFRFYMEIPFQLLPLLIALYTHGCRTTWVLHTAGSEGKQLSGVAGSEDAKRALHRRDGSSAATLLFKAIVQWKINK